MKKRTSLNKDQQQEVIKLYQDGEYIQEIYKKFNITHIDRILKANNIKTDRRLGKGRKIRIEKYEQSVLELNKKEYSITKISHILKINTKVVKEVYKKNNIEIKLIKQTEKKSKGIAVDHELLDKSFAEVKCISGIYSIRNKINNKVYIGSSYNIKERIGLHLRQLINNHHHSVMLQNSWNKHGKENFELLILSVVEDIDKLIEIEQKFMDQYQSYNPEFGYNIFKFAGSTRGRIMSDKQKADISNRNKGRKQSKELLEIKRKLMIEKWKTKEYRESFINGWSKVTQMRPFICIEDGTILRSLTRAVNTYGFRGIDIRSHLNEEVKIIRPIKGKYFIYLDRTDLKLDDDVIKVELSEQQKIDLYKNKGMKICLCMETNEIIKLYDFPSNVPKCRIVERINANKKIDGKTYKWL